MNLKKQCMFSQVSPERLGKQANSVQFNTQKYQMNYIVLYIFTILCGTIKLIFRNVLCDFFFGRLFIFSYLIFWVIVRNHIKMIHKIWYENCRYYVSNYCPLICIFCRYICIYIYIYIVSFLNIADFIK